MIISETGNFMTGNFKINFLSLKNDTR